MGIKLEIKQEKKIFSQTTACALIAVANVTVAANASSSANASASANSSAAAHSSASAKSSASATSSASANAFGYGFNAPTIYRPTAYTRPLPPTNYQSLKPCTTAYN